MPCNVCGRCGLFHKPLDKDCAVYLHDSVRGLTEGLTNWRNAAWALVTELNALEWATGTPWKTHIAGAPKAFEQTPWEICREPGCGNEREPVFSRYCPEHKTEARRNEYREELIQAEVDSGSRCPTCRESYWLEFLDEGAVVTKCSNCKTEELKKVI